MKNKAQESKIVLFSFANTFLFENCKILESNVYYVGGRREAVISKQLRKSIKLNLIDHIHISRVPTEERPT